MGEHKSLIKVIRSLAVLSVIAAALFFVANLTINVLPDKSGTRLFGYRFGMSDSGLLYALLTRGALSRLCGDIMTALAFLGGIKILVLSLKMRGKTHKAAGNQ